jgi:hypothetical protein
LKYRTGFSLSRRGEPVTADQRPFLAPSADAWFKDTLRFPVLEVLRMLGPPWPYTCDLLADESFDVQWIDVKTTLPARLGCASSARIGYGPIASERDPSALNSSPQNGTTFQHFSIAHAD